MANPKQRRDDEIHQPDIIGNAVERTDNGFDGRKDDERLIGRDVPEDEQDAEEEEEADRP